MNVRVLLAATAVAMFGALVLLPGAARASAGPTNLTAPTISGTVESIGNILTADPGTWSGDTSGGFSYQWEDCDPNGLNCNPISGATNSTYTVQSSDINSTIVVEVSAGSTVAVSSATDPVGG